MAGINYKTAGVDVEAGNEAVRCISRMVESTFSPQVLSRIGGFSAMYDIKPLLTQYDHPVLVQSIDGVGTKMMVANRMQKFDTIGIDLVSATSNDVIVMGATPLTLLDYIANDKLKPAIIEQMIKGMVAACLDNGISLVGGETAEMPGTYLSGEYDLVGIVTGVVEKDKAITGRTIQQGDTVLALASSGLHTNGYSLARKLLFEVAGYEVDSLFPDGTQTVGEELLIPHLNYTRPILHALKEGIVIKGMAHITGGGVLENIPRILPGACAVEIHRNKLPTQPLWGLLQHLGRLDEEQMYRTFNMGLGLVVILSPEFVEPLFQTLRGFNDFSLLEIGQVVNGSNDVRLL